MAVELWQRDVSWPCNLKISPWFQKDNSLEERLLRQHSSLNFITRSVSFQQKKFYKMLTCAKLGATVNEKQSIPSDARRLGSKQTKISLLNKCIAQCRNRHTAAIVTPPRSSHRRDRHTAAANFAQLLYHPLHLCDRSMLVSFLKHPNRVQVQQYRLKSF